MTCREFEKVLPDIIEDGKIVEQQSHLTACPNCSDLVSDLKTISRQARLLQESDEPSPRVWNSLELALRHEGLIRDLPTSSPRRVESRSRWRVAWLVPAMAVLLLSIGFLRYQRNSEAGPSPRATNMLPAREDSARFKDQDFLKEVTLRSPDMRESYGANLENADAYIQDAEDAAKNNPNDEEAQRYVINAYEQRAMIYEMALDRPLQ
jgi:hypothetical protein